MTTDPLREIQDVKDKLAQESGYDIYRFFQQLEEWVAENPMPEAKVITPEELRREKARSKAALGAKT